MHYILTLNKCQEPSVRPEDRLIRKISVSIHVILDSGLVKAIQIKPRSTHPWDTWSSIRASWLNLLQSLLNFPLSMQQQMGLALRRLAYRDVLQSQSHGSEFLPSWLTLTVPRSLAEPLMEPDQVRVLHSSTTFASQCAYFPSGWFAQDRSNFGSSFFKSGHNEHCGSRRVSVNIGG